MITGTAVAVSRVMAVAVEVLANTATCVVDGMAVWLGTGVDVTAGGAVALKTAVAVARRRATVAGVRVFEGAGVLLGVGGTVGLRLNVWMRVCVGKGVQVGVWVGVLTGEHAAKSEVAVATNLLCWPTAETANGREPRFLGAARRVRAFPN